MPGYISLTDRAEGCNMIVVRDGRPIILIYTDGVLKLKKWKPVKYFILIERIVVYKKQSKKCLSFRP